MEGVLATQRGRELQTPAQSSCLDTLSFGMGSAGYCELGPHHGSLSQDALSFVCPALEYSSSREYLLLCNVVLIHGNSDKKTCEPWQFRAHHFPWCELCHHCEGLKKLGDWHFRSNHHCVAAFFIKGLGALARCQAWAFEVGELSSGHWTTRDLLAPRNINRWELSQRSPSQH